MTIIELVRDPITDRMRELEARFGGVPIREILIAKLRQHGSIRGAARELGMSHENMRIWMARFDIRIVKSKG